MKRLDCGHTPSPHSEISTGTAHTPDGREICWTCADVEIKRDLLATRPGETGPMLYLTKPTAPVLSTWSGGTMLRVTSLTTRPVGFSRDGRTYFRAVDPDTGAKFYGTSPGFEMYARVRRAKGEAQP